MILHIFWLCVLAWSSIKCEPPINSYLPPSNNGGSRPSSEYEPPRATGNGAFGGSRPGGSTNPQNQVQDNYLPPGRSGQGAIDTQYGVPSSRGIGQGSGPRGFGSPSQGFNQGLGKNLPDSQYGIPSQRTGSSSRLTDSQTSFGGGSRSHSQSAFNSPNGDSSPRNGGFGSSAQRPESSYGPPPTGFQSIDGNIGPVGHLTNRRPGNPGSFNSPSTSDQQSKFGGSQTSASYTSPDFGGTGDERGLNGQGSNYNEGDSNEPAKYQFSYEVDDSQTGTKFGHSEQRDGDLATGEYNVVLPDGRKQVVEYEAGLQGYKPQIRYEGGNGGIGGDKGRYTQNGQGFGSDSDFGVIGSGPGSHTAAKFRDSNGFSEANALSDQGDSGYPSGRPRNNIPSQESSRFTSGNHGQGGNGQRSGTSGANNGFENGGGQGYPRGGPGNNGGFNEDPKIGGGYPTGGPQGGDKRSQGTNLNGNDGYPSGGPNGPRGSGY